MFTEKIFNISLNFQNMFDVVYPTFRKRFMKPLTTLLQLDLFFFSSLYLLSFWLTYINCNSMSSYTALREWMAWLGLWVYSFVCVCDLCWYSMCGNGGKFAFENRTKSQLKAKNVVVQTSFSPSVLYLNGEKCKPWKWEVFESLIWEGYGYGKCKLHPICVGKAFAVYLTFTCVPT